MACGSHVSINLVPSLHITATAWAWPPSPLTGTLAGASSQSPHLHAGHLPTHPPHLVWSSWNAANGSRSSQAWLLHPGPRSCRLCAGSFSGSSGPYRGCSLSHMLFLPGSAQSSPTLGSLSYLRSGVPFQEWPWPRFPPSRPSHGGWRFAPCIWKLHQGRATTAHSEAWGSVGAQVLFVDGTFIQGILVGQERRPQVASPAGWTLRQWGEFSIWGQSRKLWLDRLKWRSWLRVEACPVGVYFPGNTEHSRAPAQGLEGLCTPSGGPRLPASSQVTPRQPGVRTNCTQTNGTTSCLVPGLPERGHDSLESSEGWPHIEIFSENLFATFLHRRFTSCPSLSPCVL